MSVQEVLVLLQFLDDLFELGGKMVAVAQGKHPELVTTPLPDLAEMDKAREAAIKRTSDT